MITKELLRKTITTHLGKSMDINILDKLVNALYNQIQPFLPNEEKREDLRVDALSLKDLEELIVAIQKLKEILSTVEPRYSTDVMYVDELKQLEFKLTEFTFNKRR